MRIYLDNCCYGRPYDKQDSDKIISETKSIRFIRKEIENGNLELVTSYMLHFENNQRPDENQRDEITKFIKSYRKIHIGIDNAENLLESVKKIMSTGIKRKDTYHVASAILANCDYFLSTDERLLKYNSDKLKLLNPIEFIKLLGDDENGK